MIKLLCLNEVCEYSFEVTEKEFTDNPNYYNRCLVCGSQLKVINIEEIVKLDIEKRVKDYVDKYFREIGVDNTLDLIARNKDSAVYRVYKAELERRGFTIKGE